MNDYRVLLSGKWLGFFLLACCACLKTTGLSAARSTGPSGSGR